MSDTNFIDAIVVFTDGEAINYTVSSDHILEDLLWVHHVPEEEIASVTIIRQFQG